MRPKESIARIGNAAEIFGPAHRVIPRLMGDDGAKAVCLDLVILGIGARPDSRPNIHRRIKRVRAHPGQRSKHTANHRPRHCIALCAPDMARDVMRRLMRHDKGKLVIVARPGDQRSRENDLRPPRPVKRLIGIGLRIGFGIDTDVKVAIAPRRKGRAAIPLGHRLHLPLHRHKPRLGIADIIRGRRLRRGRLCRRHTGPEQRHAHKGHSDQTKAARHCLPPRCCTEEFRSALGALPPESKGLLFHRPPNALEIALYGNRRRLGAPRIADRLPQNHLGAALSKKAVAHRIANPHPWRRQALDH